MSACGFSRCYRCHEYSHQCLCESSLPAQPASTLDTSPPSRTSNAASENGAAPLFTIDVKKRDEFYAITCAEMPGLLLAGKDFMVLLDDLPLAWRILRQLNDVSPDTCTFTNLASRPHIYPDVAPMSETAIRAVVYGCTDAQCVCGRCTPVRIAVDPWQGLGKTWGS